MAVSDNADRLACTAIDQQNNHLAIALLCVVVRTWAACMGMAGNAQVEGADYLQAGRYQLVDQPNNRLNVRQFQSQEGEIIAH